MYRVYVYIALFVLWTGSAYLFGHSIGYDKRDLMALNASKKSADEYQTAMNKRDADFKALQAEVSKYAQDAWSKYNDAQKELDTAVADSERWRVRFESKPASNCGVQTPSARVMDDDNGADYRELPPETQRRLERIGDEVTRDLKQCRAKVYALQRYVEQVVK